MLSLKDSTITSVEKQKKNQSNGETSKTCSEQERQPSYEGLEKIAATAIPLEYNAMPKSPVMSLL